MQQYASAAEASNAEVIVFCDAYDVIMHKASGPKLQGLLQFFRDHLQTELLVGAETGCAASSCVPVDAYWASAPLPYACAAQSSGLVHVQAGVIAGRPRALAAMYKWILAQDPIIKDDQIGLGHYANHIQWPTLCVDTQRLLVHNVAYQDHVLGMWPDSPFMHFPGWPTRFGLSPAYEMAKAKHVYRNSLAFYLSKPGLVAALLVVALTLIKTRRS